MTDTIFKSVSIIYEGENLGTVTVEHRIDFLKDLMDNGKVPKKPKPRSIEFKFHTEDFDG